MSRIVLSLIILSLLLAPLQLQAAGGGTLKTVVWEHYFGDPKYSYLNRSSAMAGNDFYLSGSFSLPGKPKDKKRNVYLWKASKVGALVTDNHLTGSYPGLGKILEVNCICESNSYIVVAVMNETGECCIATVDSTGQVAAVKKFEVGVVITKVIPSNNGSYVLIGRKETVPFVVKIAGNGNELWRKTLERGRDDMINDGLSAENGGFVLLETSGKMEKLLMTDSDLFVAMYDAKGVKVNERYLPGRNGSMTRDKNGNYVIVYDKSSTPEQDIWVQAYDKNLKPLWSRSITTAKYGFQIFKIVSLVNGNYVVAGPVNGKPSITYLDSTGVKKWDYLSEKEDELNINLDLVTDGSDCYLVSTIITLNSDKLLINRIKVTKFKPQL